MIKHAELRQAKANLLVCHQGQNDEKPMDVKQEM